MSRRRGAPLDAAAARVVAGDLLSRKAWSQRELERRLVRRGAPAAVAAEVVADLAARGYLDDAQFARHWVQTRASVRFLGPLRLRDELRARGVDTELAEAALRESFDTEGELARALEAGRRKLRTLEGAERRARRSAADPGREAQRAALRLHDHLLRQGYPGGVVTRVVRTLLAL